MPRDLLLVENVIFARETLHLLWVATLGEIFGSLVLLIGRVHFSLAVSDTDSILNFVLKQLDVCPYRLPPGGTMCSF